MSQYELEVGVMRATFGDRANTWIAALEAALDTADEGKRGSIVEVRKRLDGQTKEFQRLVARRKEINEEADEIRKLVIGDGEMPALDAVMQVADRVDKLHEEAIQTEKQSAWVFIQAMVSLRRLRKLLEDAMPGSSVGIEAQIKRDAGLE